MTTTLRIGFIPLVDAALLVAARDEGFAEAEGLALDLKREVSWANIRDKLNVGLFDAAHMLAPAAIASTLGLGHIKVPLAAPVALNLNGNAITVSRRLCEDLAAAADGDIDDPAVSARALARLAARRKAAGQEPFTFAMTFAFSTHHYQLRIWMRAGGVDPDEDVRLVVIPPPLMARSLESGHIDGFCVGAPWNALTVAAGGAAILHPGLSIVANCPEKVLAVRAEAARQPGQAIAPLIRALRRAAAWCASPANRPLLARHLARADVLGVAAPMIERILAGNVPTGLDGRVVPRADFIRLDPGTLKPLSAHAEFLFEQMAAAGQVAGSSSLLAAARAVYRPDMFDAAVGTDQAPAPDLPEILPQR